jgi:hypothetical protein
MEPQPTSVVAGKSGSQFRIGIKIILPRTEVASIFYQQQTLYKKTKKNVDLIRHGRELKDKLRVWTVFFAGYNSAHLMRPGEEALIPDNAGNRIK